MSTIEEAREQARAALANHAVNIMETDYWCDVVLAPALRALLDATEPSTVAVKTEFRVLDAPKDCDYHEGFEEGIKVGRAGSGPRPITDEGEREALTTLISATTYQTAWGECVRAADAILADGYAKGPRPITGEMVEAAACEYHERGNGEGSFARTSEHVRTSLLFRMKCALNAAEGARR